MPRPEDIAWKFVVRLEGKRWRCPYCHKESSGSVTRVKSHFLKQPKEGIASCTKVPEHIRTLMELLLNHELHNRDDIAWKFVNRVEDSKWRCYYCSGEFFGDLTGVKGHLLGVPNEGISICTGVPNHVRTLMWSLLDAVAEEESRGANGQSSMEPQSRHMPTQLSPSFSPETLEYLGPLLPTPRGATNMANFTQQGVIGSNSDQQSQAHRQFHQSSAMSLLAQSSHVQPALVPHQHQSVLHQSINHETRDTQWNATMPLDNLDTTQQPDLHDFPPENLVEYRDVIVNSPEEIQMNEQHNLTVGSSLQNDLSPDVDSTNRLQDCSQPCVGEGVSGLSNTSPTNAVQHPDQLHPRCDWEGGNDTRFVPSPTPVDVNCFLALPHSSDSLDNLHVVEAATNAIGSSSSQDLNRGYPIMTVWSIYANDEEIRNLKRKVEELNDKEAVIKKQMEIESAASSVRKKPRLVHWLEETEMARNSFHKIGQANAETLPPKEQVETLTRAVEKLIEQTTLLIEERDAKGVKFLERKLTGEAIHRNIELIWGRLKENHACKLGIYGMGGVGKTTILMQIHNRLLKDATFDGVVFITVSQDFSIYKLQSDIWKALKFGVMEDEDKEKRAAMLLERLERKKNCVLILDDVWKYLDLEKVGIPIREDGFKLVLTTRSFDVCCQMLCDEKIKIEPLFQEEAEKLFFEELGSKVVLDSEIKAIAKSIVKECAGLPIGVITMARSMRGVTNVFEWRDFLVQLRESSMGQMNVDRRLLMSLKVGYDRLVNPIVQQCFLSCALYPEDEFIDKFELVEFFIDQGLIDGLNSRGEQYDRGLTILNKLGNVCLLEDHEGNMKMHDLIRDMALHIMGTTSIVKAGKQLMGIPSEERWTDALEKVSLMKNDIRAFPLNMSPNCPKLSTLLLNGCLLSNVVVPDSFFKNLLGLKVLNLSGCDLIELPNSISDLVNLRALLLQGCYKLCRIPYLGKLTSLRKLDVNGCSKLEVPEGLGKLVNLKYLDLGCIGTERLPKGTLGALLNLQYLNVEAVDGEDITKLKALETLECTWENVDDFDKCARDDFNNCVRAIDHINPCYYDLYVEQGGSSYDVEVKVKKDAPCRNRERKVFISVVSHAIVSMGVKCTGNFVLIPRDVQKMAAEGCDPNLSGMGLLSDLEELEIIRWKNLRVLCGGQDEEVIDLHDFAAPTPTPLLFLSLRVLDIWDCPKLKYLFGHGSTFTLPHLQKIKISVCEEMVGITVAVTSPFHLLPAFPRLEKIKVKRCDKMKRVVESKWIPHFPNLKSIRLLWCKNMEEIIDQHDSTAPTPTPLLFLSLRVLDIWECPKLKYLFGHGSKFKLPHLQEITIKHCEEMVGIIAAVTSPPHSLLAFSSLEVIYVVGCDKMKRAMKSEWMPHFPNLKSITVSWCENMEEIIDLHDSTAPTPTPLLFLSLRVLNIERCPKLKYLFGHGSKFKLPHLREIEISDCEEIVGIIAAVASPPHPLLPFPSLEVIYVNGCDKMKRAVESEWMPHFPNLKSIKVSCCKNMEEIIGGPPPDLPVEGISLESLQVECCENMRKLFPLEWLLHLQNLQKIYVGKCEGMVEMISGAGQGQEGSIMTPVNNTPSFFQRSSISLPKLKLLCLRFLPQLKSICGVPISCDSMEELGVYKCPELKGIPLQLQLRETKELPHIKVEDEGKWKTLMWDRPNAQAILQPYLRKGEHANWKFKEHANCELSFWSEWRSPNAIELDAKG